MEIGLVMQGGGALGAYEYGAVQALLEHGCRPVVISGVSIGAFNTVALAGAPSGDAGPDPAAMKSNIEALWRRVTLADNPFLPHERQGMMSAFGDPGLWRLRADWYAASTWTSLTDTGPMLKTLSEVVDFDGINRDTPPVRIAITATCIETGANTIFSNVDPNHPALAVSGVIASTQGLADLGMIAIKERTRITAQHVMASGALPPGFPMIEIDGLHYWDGGLFDNTPLRPLVEMLTDAEADSMPIVVINLFPEDAPVPRNLTDVQTRMMEIQYESRFTDRFGGPQGTRDYAAMLGKLRALEQAQPGLFAGLGDPAQFRHLLLYRALRNLHVIKSEPSFTPTGAMDFSAFGVENRRKAGHAAVESYFERNGGTFPHPDPA